jgi:hypothetical protein
MGYAISTFYTDTGHWDVSIPVSRRSLNIQCRLQYQKSSKSIGYLLRRNIQAEERDIEGSFHFTAWRKEGINTSQNEGRKEFKGWGLE